MKRSLPLVLAAVLAAGLALAAAAETVNVIVKRTAVRRDHQFYAPSVGEAQFGDRLTVLGREKDWIQVDAGGTQGWVHATAVTAKAVKASAGGGAVSSDEVALAAKGFNSQVESEYRKKNPDANFAAVDRMEKLAVPEDSVAEFVRDGNLHPRGAGR
jgi:uncharacterized protein YraI